MSLKELIKTNLPRSILIFLLYILYAIGGAADQYVYKFFMNDITQGNLKGFISWQFIELVLKFLTIILLPLVTILFTRQIQNYIHQIREEITEHYYDSEDAKVSEMQNELSGNLKRLNDNYAVPMISIFNGILEVILSVAVLASMSWILIVVDAVFVILTFLLPKLTEKINAQAMDESNKMNEKLLNIIDHWFSGLQELQRYNAYGRLVNKLQKASENYRDANKKSFKYQSLGYVINGIGNAIAQIVTAFIAGLLFLNRTISFGDMVVATSFSSSIFFSIWTITESITQVKSTKTLREQTIELRAKVTNENEAKKYAYGVKVSNLLVKYQEGESISYPDFEIKPGQKVLLTGDSGTGKSTLFKVLLGQLEKESGTIEYLDKDGKVLDSNEAKLGYLPQDPIVFPVSIKENITMFNEKLQDKLANVVNAVQLQEDLVKMPAGINTQVSLSNENLSGGQRQRVVLARSEIHEQPMVLMDEVTSAIDQGNTEKIINNLLKTDQTILMIAHNFTPELKAKFDQEIKLIAPIKEED